MLVSQQNGIYEGIITAGLRLAETPEAEGGFREYFDGSLSESLEIKDDYLRASTALLMENGKRWLADMTRARMGRNGQRVIDEATRSALVGGWSDYLFPIIRASFPVNPINDLVSVQPTTRRVATVIYWNWIVGRGKGRYVKGSRLFDANVGKRDAGYNFSNETVQDEPLAALGAPGATYTGTLQFADGGGVRPGTVRITAFLVTAAANATFTDNGNGGFVITGGGGATISASSINYLTGQFSITLAGDTFSTATTNVATYKWDSEGSGNLPEVDVQVITSTVETERRALRINYSMESVQDVMSEFGVSLEPELVKGASEQLNFEIARQIISEIWAVAPVASTFPLTGPTEFSQQAHFRDIVFNLNQASNLIWSRTQKGHGNWIVCDEGAANLIESLPETMFKAAPRPSNVQGLHFIGTLMGKFRVYKDLLLAQETGASAYGNMLMGFKGTQFYEAGFVWSPYQLLYTTDSIMLADFNTQKGLANRSATKMVNRDMYVRISLGA